MSKAHKHGSHPIRSAENDEACKSFELRAARVLANDSRDRVAARGIAQWWGGVQRVGLSNAEVS
jgi:hypothetical protein